MLSSIQTFPKNWPQQQYHWNCKARPVLSNAEVNASSSFSQEPSAVMPPGRKALRQAKVGEETP